MRRVIEVDGLFDGERVSAGGMAIVVVDDTIVWVGKRARVPKTPKGERSEAVRAPGSFVLPGLVNCHAHLAHDGLVDFSGEARLPAATQALKAFRNARIALRSGVTTVRDLGANGTMVIELARAIAAGMLEGPRIVAAGRGITTTGGHGLEIGRMADGADGARRATREQLMAGASVIKIFATGGVLGEGASPEVSQFTLAEAQAAVEEAHKGGLRATAHAHGAQGVRVAIEAGIDSIEHATLLDARTVKLLKEREVAIVPTLSALAALRDHLDALAPHEQERTRAVAAKQEESVRMAHRAGVRIVAGTDAGTPFNDHGHFSVELELLSTIGLGAEKALHAGTAGAADVVGRERAGRIAAGAFADLLFVDGDPLADLATLRRPRGVWVGGRAS